MVKVMVSPTLGVELFTVLTTARSACCGVSVALALLLPVLGSNWSARLMAAVLVGALALATCATSRRVRAASVSTLPTVQIPVPLAYVPWLGLAETKLSPAGSASLTCTLLAAFGPLLLKVTVKVIVSPTLGVALLTLLLSARSACCGVSVTLALLF